MNLLDLLFPKRCVGCGKVGSYICATCVNLIRPVENQVCPMCGRPSMWGKTHEKCVKPLGMNGVTTVFVYRGIGKRLITKMKYRLVTSLIDELMESVISLAEFGVLERGDWVAVPVPLHARKVRQRGFNQAAMIAARLGMYLNWEVEDVLERTRYTKSQVGMSAEERMKNVKGVFTVKSEEGVNSLKGRRVVLVDDVWTTGSTMRECAKVLKRAGVKVVWGLAVAA